MINPHTNDDPRIGPVPADRREEAVRLLLSRLPREDQPSHIAALSAELATEPSLADGLFGAFLGDRLVGVVFVQLQPGKTAVVWPPRIEQGQPDVLAEQLLHAACAELPGRNVRLAMALLYTDCPDDERVLRNERFEFLSNLLYLVSPEDKFPNSPPETSIEFEPYCEANHERLARVVADSYHETQDCPALNGVREIEDVLTGYKASGVFDPSRWLILRHQGQDVGCLLLTDHPTHGNWELVYMGIPPSSRGHGWGLDVTREAQWLTRQAGRPRLVLAVDATNKPAIDVYATAGFRVWDRRLVYARVFPPLA